MTRNLKELETLANSLRNQHNDLRVDNTYDILRTSAIINGFLNASYRKVRMKQNQVILLSFLLANGGVMTPTELKTKVFRSNNAIGSSLDGLDKLGLTKSSGSKTDRRLRRVTLTEKGLEMVKQILPVRRTLFTKATSCLNQEEQQALQSILEKLENHLLGTTRKIPKPKTKKFYF